MWFLAGLFLFISYILYGSEMWQYFYCCKPAVYQSACYQQIHFQTGTESGYCFIFTQFSWCHPDNGGRAVI